MWHQTEGYLCWKGSKYFENIRPSELPSFGTGTSKPVGKQVKKKEPTHKSNGDRCLQDKKKSKKNKPTNKHKIPISLQPNRHKWMMEEEKRKKRINPQSNGERCVPKLYPQRSSPVLFLERFFSAGELASCPSPCPPRVRVSGEDVGKSEKGIGELFKKVVQGQRIG